VGCHRGSGPLRGRVHRAGGRRRAALGRWQVGVRSTRVIPCLDVDAGRVVKGVNFVNLVDAGDPVELAARYDTEGADEVVFLDITASSDARDTIVDVARRTAEQVFIPFTVGGGVRTVDDARRLLRAGADAVGVPVIASGGVGTLEHLAEGALEGGADAVLAASIFHFGEHTVRAAKEHLTSRGLVVRPA